MLDQERNKPNLDGWENQVYSKLPKKLTCNTDVKYVMVQFRFTSLLQTSF
jgi:hypothetical protein